MWTVAAFFFLRCFPNMDCLLSMFGVERQAVTGQLFVILRGQICIYLKFLGEMLLASLSPLFPLCKTQHRMFFAWDWKRSARPCAIPALNTELDSTNSTELQKQPLEAPVGFMIFMCYGMMVVSKNLARRWQAICIPEQLAGKICLVELAISSHESARKVNKMLGNTTKPKKSHTQSNMLKTLCSSFCVPLPNKNVMLL